jgi:hypothetical protein
MQMGRISMLYSAISGKKEYFWRNIKDGCYHSLTAAVTTNNT